MNKCKHKIMNDALYCPMCSDIYSIEYVETLENGLKRIRDKYPENSIAHIWADEALEKAKNG